MVTAHRTGVRTVSIFFAHTRHDRCVTPAARRRVPGYGIHDVRNTAVAAGPPASRKDASSGPTVKERVISLVVLLVIVVVAVAIGVTIDHKISSNPSPSPSSSSSTIVISGLAGHANVTLLDQMSGVAATVFPVLSATSLPVPSSSSPPVPSSSPSPPSSISPAPSTTHAVLSLGTDPAARILAYLHSRGEALNVTTPRPVKAVYCDWRDVS